MYANARIMACSKSLQYDKKINKIPFVHLTCFSNNCRFGIRRKTKCLLNWCWYHIQLRLPDTNYTVKFNLSKYFFIFITLFIYHIVKCYNFDVKRYYEKLFFLDLHMHSIFVWTMYWEIYSVDLELMESNKQQVTLPFSTFLSDTDILNCRK